MHAHCTLHGMYLTASIKYSDCCIAVRSTSPAFGHLAFKMVPSLPSKLQRWSQT